MRIEAFIRKNGEILIQFVNNGKSYSLVGDEALKYVRNMWLTKQPISEFKNGKMHVTNLLVAKDIRLFEGKKRLMAECGKDIVMINGYKRIKKSNDLVNSFKPLIYSAENIESKEKRKILHKK